MAPPVIPNPLFLLDYDGTLAPIVDDPVQAVPHADIPALLEQLSARYPLVLVTGRLLADLGKLVTLPLDAVGRHGTQRGRLGGDIADLIPDESRNALSRLREALPPIDGIRVEEKHPMFAIHYRLAPDKEAVRKALRKWLEEVPDVLDPIWGKDVVELRPKGISKGTAVKTIAERYPNHIPVYLGDDVTDEDAFRALDDDAVTVKVGDGETAAQYRLPDVDAVVQYLRRYLL